MCAINSYVQMLVTVFNVHRTLLFILVLCILVLINALTSCKYALAHYQTNCILTYSQTNPSQSEMLLMNSERFALPLATESLEVGSSLEVTSDNICKC